jgi:hypothetical protein
MAEEVEIAWTAQGIPHVIKKHVNDKFHTACGRYLSAIADNRYVDARHLGNDTCRKCAGSHFVFRKAGYRTQGTISQHGKTQTMTTANPETRLTEAYHLVFDVKDDTEHVPPGSEAASQALRALNAIKQLAQQLDITMPRRFDGDGRKDTQ